MVRYNKGTGIDNRYISKRCLFSINRVLYRLNTGTIGAENPAK